MENGYELNIPTYNPNHKLNNTYKRSINVHLQVKVQETKIKIDDLGTEGERCGYIT